MANRQLTPQEHRFVQALLKGRGKAESAIEAGYSEKSAGRLAHKLLQKPVVRQALADFYAAEEWQIRTDRERLRRKLLSMAEAETDQLFDEHWRLKPKSEVPKDVRALVVTARYWDSPEQGKGSAVKVVNPNESIRTYLKLFPAPPQNTSSNLDDAVRDVEEEMDALIDRLNGDEDEEWDDVCAP